jgi:hypothetical protein
MAYRSAKTGKYISKAAAARWPGRSVRESTNPSSNSGRTVHRSAVTGRFVTGAATKRRPNHTLTEKV